MTVTPAAAAIYMIISESAPLSNLQELAYLNSVTADPAGTLRQNSHTRLELNEPMEQRTICCDASSEERASFLHR